MNNEELVRNLVLEMINDTPELYLVDVSISGKGNAQQVKVLIDGDAGISIDTCAEMSRKLSTTLDEEDSFDGSYNLEVSSPGTDYPLTAVRQYKKNIGRSIKVLMEDGSQNEGTLQQVNNSFIVLAVARNKKKPKVKEEVEIPLDQIKQAKVLVSFK